MEHGSVQHWRKGERLYHDPLRGTNIAPVALDCESARTRLGTRQLPVLASARRLCPKAVPFSGFRYIRAEKRDFLS